APTPAPKRKAGAKSAAPGLPQEPHVKKRKLMHKMVSLRLLVLLRRLSPKTPSYLSQLCYWPFEYWLFKYCCGSQPFEYGQSVYHQRAEGAGRGATTTFEHERAWTITPGGWSANTLYDMLSDFLVFAFGFIFQIELFA
ncbi:hypothetical protein FRC10_006674, partial [Ceratobasidium sp. 414]